jgi:hypothetical protein
MTGSAPLQVDRLSRGRSIDMIKLTQEREITPYVWVHPDEDDRR